MSDYPKTTAFRSVFKMTRIIERSASDVTLELTDVARAQFDLEPIFTQTVGSFEEACTFAQESAWPACADDSPPSADVPVEDAAAWYINKAYRDGMMDALSYCAALIATSHEIHARKAS